jgi:hypothetical protein
MLKHTLLIALAAACTLAFTAGAQAAYLTLGTTNTSNAPTTLGGNTAGAELLGKNANGASANAFGLYGLLTSQNAERQLRRGAGLQQLDQRQGLRRVRVAGGLGDRCLRVHPFWARRLGEYLKRNRRARF